MPTTTAAAYCGPAPGPETLAWSWNLDPWLIGALALAAIVLERDTRGDRRRRAAAAAGLGALAVAFVSPLCALTVALLSARAVHHLVVFGVAAPLLAAAWRPRGSAPGAVAPWIASTVVWWAWHVPPVYDASLAGLGAYVVLQLALLASAIWLWRAVIGGWSRPAAPLALAASAAQMGALGALLTFAPRPLYRAHLDTTAAFGLEPLADQQLAGLTMWVPGALPLAVLGALWMRDAWRRAVAAT